MAAPDAFRVEGEVVETRAGRLAVVKLANGHQVLGHGSLASAGKIGLLKAGDRIWIEISPSDMSVGRIKFNDKQN